MPKNCRLFLLNQPLLEKYIHDTKRLHQLKPDNEARIILVKRFSQTKNRIFRVYLHGFSASQEEGDPVHMICKKIRMQSLFSTGLAEHGIDTTEPMANLTADKLWNSAKEAYAIGKQLGKKVILLATSTGGNTCLKTGS